ncbi:MAG: PQQ-binding-like beta-propeller repeat protein [Phycisphaerales bacterium]|nr:MAG: PQQ-binding-like beta-propeller repeat protein [Phycisphaerales bacterium]
MYSSKPAQYTSIMMLILSLVGTIYAENAIWPQFRGPGGLGIAPDNQTYSTELDTSKNLLWKTEVPKGYSSPCIWANHIFITARSGNKLETICIDRKSGEIEWRKSVEPETMEKIGNMNSHASSTPASDGKKVYVYFGSFGLIAYDFDGNEIWSKPLEVPEMQHGSASSPILAENMVIMNCDQKKAPYILAVDCRSGKTIWRQEREIEKAGWSTPVFWNHGDEKELVVLGSHKLISYDPKDGQKIWWLYDLPVRATCTPVYAGETLFVAAAVTITGDPVNPIELPDYKELLEMYDSDRDDRLVISEIPNDVALVYRFGPRFSGLKNAFRNLDADEDGNLDEEEWKQVTAKVAKIKPRRMDSLVAIRSGGKGDVSNSHINWRTNEGIGQVPSPLAYQDLLYLLKHGGIVTCYDTTKGDRIYSNKLGSRVYYNASPVGADGKIYFCSVPGVVFVVKAGNTFQVLSRNKIGERINATPALVDGNIYLRTAKHMMAFGGS